MEMVLHGHPSKMKGKKPPSKKVAQDFENADKGRSIKSLPKKVSKK
jgi:hypothetical protein